MSESIKIDLIRTDLGTQTRASICEQTVAEYAERMLEGDKFPPVILYHDGNDYILSSGFHRVFSAKRAGFKDVLAEVRKGTLLDAIEHSLSANNSNGLKRTNADKRRSVEMAIKTFAAWSDRKVSEVCGVSHPFVATIRGGQLETVTSSPRIGADGKTRKMPAPKSNTITPEKAKALMANVEPTKTEPPEPVQPEPIKTNLPSVLIRLEELMDDGLRLNEKELGRLKLNLEICVKKVAAEIRAKAMREEA